MHMMAFYAIISVMAEVKRITANLPLKLLEEALKVSGQGITETLIRGLQSVKAQGAYQKAQKLKSNLVIDVDIEESRERTSR